MDAKISSNLFELQLSLENSLCLLTRKRSILSKKLSNAYPEKKDEKSKASSSDNGEKSDKPYKKLKLSSEKTQKSSFSARAKGKRAQPAKSQENGFSGKSDIPKVQKNDSNNRFWSFLECYCSDLSSETIKVLEEWIESHEKDSEYQNIPELGSHYSTKMIEDNLLEEKIEGTKSMENPKGTNISIMEKNELEMLSKVQDTILSLHPEQPPLAEKLLSMLVQENIITSPNDIMTESTPDDNIQSKRAEEKVTHISSSLENRLRKQLEELGILEKGHEESDDELLQELKSLQALLIPVSELNLKKKKALLSRSKAEIAKQEAQKRIQEMDAKVMENYRMMTSARSKGKKLSKKELCQIRNILEERDNLIRNTKIVF